MSNLIDRQAAIDEINKRQRKLVYCFGFENDMVKIMDIAKSIVIATPSVQPERKMGEWIPCSERLPEEYGEYLITWETSKAPTRFIGFAEGEETGVWDDQHDRFVFSWLPEDYIIERYPDWRVIAWMPLPEPYKGEQE